jgi:hypothetical protein
MFDSYDRLASNSPLIPLLEMELFGKLALVFLTECARYSHYGRGVMIRRSIQACVTAAAALCAAASFAHAAGANALGLLSLGNVAPVQFDLGSAPADPLANPSLTANITSHIAIGNDLDAPLIANGLLLDSAKPASSNIALSNNLNLHVGGSLLTASSAEPAMPVISYLSSSAQQALAQTGGGSADASLNWSLPKLGFGIGVGAAVSNANNVFLAGSGFSNATQRTVGVSARFGNGWVTTVSYGEGVNQLNLKPGSLLSDDSVKTQTYGFAVAKHGLFGDNDLLGVAVSRPVQLFGGNFNFGSDSHSLIGPAEETDISLGYVTTFFNGALALQANAAWQMNLEGQKDTNSLAVLSRAKFNF